MSLIENNSSYNMDVVTGERIDHGELMIDTGLRNKHTTSMARSRTRLVKESTIVWLAEQAGYSVVKRDAGNSGNTESVDGADASVGGGEVKVGAVKAGRKSTVKRSADGESKG